MQLDRSQFLKAVKFLKPAILVTEGTEPMTNVHVKIVADRCQLTAANGVCGKRVTLVTPAQIAFDETEKPDDDQEFMIDKATLESFETLCQKHKAIFERAAKADQTLKLIDIFSNVLESHKDRLNYIQPLGTFKDIGSFFFLRMPEPIVTGSIKINSLIMIDALKEFSGAVEMTFSGDTGPIYVRQPDSEYQAFFLPFEPRKEDGQ